MCHSRTGRLFRREGQYNGIYLLIRILVQVGVRLFKVSPLFTKNNLMSQIEKQKAKKGASIIRPLVDPDWRLTFTGQSIFSACPIGKNEIFSV